MTVVKRNIIANYFGQLWTGLMAIAFLPVYIDYLGVEAYGLIGLFVVLQTLLVLLDAGMTPTLNREMARFKAGAHSGQSIWQLLRTLEIMCLAIASVIFLALWNMSGYLANSWLNVDKLPIQIVEQSIGIMALIIAMRFCEGIYRGALFGLEKQVWYNVVNSILATLRYGGAIIVLEFISPSINSFFLWQLIVSLVITIAFSMKVHATLPKKNSNVRFSYTSFLGVWKFAGGMMAVTLLAMMFFQTDKILVSKFLSLEDFGYYSLAATAAGIIFMIVVPVTQAIYPKLVGYVTNENDAEIISLYHKMSQLVTILSAPVSLLLFFYATGVVFLWSGNLDLASNTGPILSVLAIGFFISGLSSLPYQVQVAHGRIRFLVLIHVIIVPILVFIAITVLQTKGLTGVAWAWVLVNALYLASSVIYMHQALMRSEFMRWFFADILLPIMGTVAVYLLSFYFKPDNYFDRLDWFVFLAMSLVVSVIVSALSSAYVRNELIAYFNKKPLKRPLQG